MAEPCVWDDGSVDRDGFPWLSSGPPGITRNDATTSSPGAPAYRRCSIRSRLWPGTRTRRICVRLPRLGSQRFRPPGSGRKVSAVQSGFRRPARREADDLVGVSEHLAIRRRRPQRGASARPAFADRRPGRHGAALRRLGRRRGRDRLIYLDGTFSHQSAKARSSARPALSRMSSGPLRTSRRVWPTPQELAVAEATFDALPWPRAALLYARVDLVRDEGGAPLLLELELAEPSLFLGLGAGAETRLAAAIAARVGEVGNDRRSDPLAGGPLRPVGDDQSGDEGTEGFVGPERLLPRL